MGDVYKLTDRPSVTEKAGQWISKLARGLDQDETEQLRTWLAEDSEHKAVFLAMARTWDEMSALETLADLFPDQPEVEARSWRPRLAAAASIAGLAGILGWYAYSSFMVDSRPARIDAIVVESSDLVYGTGIGEQSTTVLADGSIITLNTDSHLIVRYSTHHRVLELTRGEVHVDVAHDPRRPLSVLAGDNIVQAVGTAFGVQITGDNEAELIVTEGEVLVGTTKRSATSAGSVLPPAPILPKTSLRVEQGEELLLGVDEATVKPVSVEEIDVKMSWREGNLIFRGEAMEDALRELERYTTVRFVFLDSELRTQGVIGRYKAGDVDAFLDALGASHNVTYTRTDDGQVLLSAL